MIYGYCRVSTRTQNIERQERNILNLYSSAKIFKEKYTGTKIDGRKEFQKLLKIVKPDDTIVFDSVSRMSRNAEKGIKTYFELFEKGVNLVFIKEPYINTEIYKESLKDKIQLTGSDEDEIFRGLNNYFKKLAQKQIKLAFEIAEKEVKDLQQRTKEGLFTAKINGKLLGNAKGAKLNVKKAKPTKEIIRTHCKDFIGGTLTDKETMLLAKVSRNTYYKYKKELIQELAND